ncbi:MAG: RidA family protein [Paracoccaceae bacterium]
MTRRLITTGSPFERDFAYSRALVAWPWCFVAGTTGYDYAAMTMPEDAGEQAANALATIARTLEEAGFAMADVVRVQTTVTEAEHRHAIAPALRAAFADIRPPATLVVAGLAEPAMKVEIEVTALARAADSA